MNDGVVITVLVCILAVIVNVIAVIILVVLCRRRRRQRARTSVVMQAERTYHVADQFEEHVGSCAQYQDENGYEIPIPPLYNHIIPLSETSGSDSHTDPEAVWREDVGPYFLEVRPEGPTRTFVENDRDQTEQHLDKEDLRKLQPRVELTLALYHKPNS